MEVIVSEWGVLVKLPKKDSKFSIGSLERILLEYNLAEGTIVEIEAGGKMQEGSHFFVTSTGHLGISFEGGGSPEHS